MAKKKTTTKKGTRSMTRSTTRSFGSAGVGPFFVLDVSVIGRVAATRSDRRTVLDDALTNQWTVADIGSIARVDQGTLHGWDMTPL